MTTGAPFSSRKRPNFGGVVTPPTEEGSPCVLRLKATPSPARPTSLQSLAVSPHREDRRRADQRTGHRRPQRVQLRRGVDAAPHDVPGVLHPLRPITLHRPVQAVPARLWRWAVGLLLPVHGGFHVAIGETWRD